MEWWQTFKKMVSEEKELPNDLPIYYNKKGELLPPPRWSTVAGLIIGGGEPSYIDFVQQREKSREVVWVVESANLRGEALYREQEALAELEQKVKGKKGEKRFTLSNVLLN